MSALFNVIIPIFNCEPYLKDCICSVLKQDLDDFELILIDDGSTDGSYNICKKFSEYDNRVKVISKKNGGASSAKNAGIKAADGKYIAFIDADDTVAPDYLSTIYEPLKNHSVDLSVCGYTVVFYGQSNNIINLPLCEKKYVQNDLYEGVIGLGIDGVLNVDVGKGYLLEIIRANNILFPEKLSTGEDLIFNCKYLTHCHSIFLKQSSCYNYIRRNTVSLVNKYCEDLFEISKQCIEAVQLMLKSIKCPVEQANDLLAVVCLDYMSACIHNIFNVQCAKSAASKKTEIRKILAFASGKNVYINCNKFALNIIQKIFLHFCKNQNANQAYIIYSILFFLRQKFSRIYLKMRKLVLNKI